MYKNLYDMHSHSIHSFDGNDSISKLCEQAVRLSAVGIAVTDHCDIDSRDLDVNKLCQSQLDDLEMCIKQYANRLDIIKGLEIGQGVYRKEEVKKLYNTYDYDFILGSIHNLENMEDFYFLDYSKFDVYALLNRYFEDLLKLVYFGYFDSLAHLTYPLRYIVAREKINVDLTKFKKITDEILYTLAKNGKALEINTSGLFMEMKDTLPNKSYVKRFKELGGKYVTVGSDSHYADKVFQGVDCGYDIARACGFAHITIFKNHEPMLIEIK